MSWATYHIKNLEEGKTVQFRPHGNSMQGKIESGQLVKLAPPPFNIEVGDIVLCKVKGRAFLHLVTAVKDQQYQISNNKGFVNGWITSNSIYGKCVSIED